MLITPTAREPRGYSVLRGAELLGISEDRDDFNRLDGIIRKGAEMFYEVGCAMREMQERKLYRTEGYKTFAAYCEERHGLTRSYAYRLIDAADVKTKMSPTGDKLPTTERQCRELAKVPEEQRADVWQAACERADAAGKAAPTAALIRETAVDVINVPPPSRPPSIPRTDTRIMSNRKFGKLCSAADRLRCRLNDDAVTLCELRSLFAELYQFLESC